MPRVRAVSGVWRADKGPWEGEVAGQPWNIWDGDARRGKKSQPGG